MRSLKSGLRLAELARDLPMPADVVGDGTTLVGFGAAGRVDEVTGDGTVRWSAALTSDKTAVALPFYRALRIRSLYEARP